MEAYAPDPTSADSLSGRSPFAERARPPGAIAALVARFEHSRRPSAAIAVVVSLLYLPSLFGGFIIDDYRALRHMSEYREGRRASLDLYRFLDGSNNAAERHEGRYPWWISDGVRYRHWRPLSERLIYGQFLLFQRHAIGYRLVSLVLYIAGVILVLRLFRAIQPNERLARWAALVYAVVPGHVLPVTFAAAQCDLWALLLAVGALLAAVRFIRAGGAAYAALAAACYAVGLGAKEAVFPCAALPLVIALSMRDRGASMRRAAITTGVLSAIGVAWLVGYVRGGFGADTAVMLDPLRAPAEYLVAFPGRALLLLSTWLIPITPFVLYFEAAWRPALFVYGAIGAAGLASIARYLWRHCRGVPGVLGMALWPLPFLPILVCTPPDDRVMMLPGIGLAYLAAICLTSLTSLRPPGATGALTVESGCLRAGATTPSGAPPTRLSRWAWYVFVGQQAAAALIAMGVLLFLEQNTRALHRAVADGFGRPIHAGDCAFLLGPSHVFHILFAQDCAAEATEGSGLGVAFLVDARQPRVEQVNERTLRLSSDAPGFLAGFVGAMGRTRAAVRQIGDTVENGEFQTRIMRIQEGGVTEIEMVFREPLSAERYRFYQVSRWGSPTEWRPRRTRP